MTERMIHLVAGSSLRRRPAWLRKSWPYMPAPLRRWYRRSRFKPFAACEYAVKPAKRLPGRDMVSIYDHPETESLITCPKCLGWLNDEKGMHRLMVTKGGMDEYLRRMIKEEPGTLRYMDIPSGNTGVVESEDDLPHGKDD